MIARLRPVTEDGDNPYPGLKGGEEEEEGGEEQAPGEYKFDSNFITRVYGD